MDYRKDNSSDAIFMKVLNQEKLFRKRRNEVIEGKIWR